MPKAKQVIRECITINIKIDAIIKKIDKFVSDVETDDRIHFLARDSLVNEALNARERFKKLRCN